MRFSQTPTCGRTGSPLSQHHIRHEFLRYCSSGRRVTSRKIKTTTVTKNQTKRRGRGGGRRRRQRKMKRKPFMEHASSMGREPRWAPSCPQSLCLQWPRNLLSSEVKTFKTTPGLCSNPPPSLPLRCSHSLTQLHHLPVTSGTDWVFVF